MSNELILKQEDIKGFNSDLATAIGLNEAIFFANIQEMTRYPHKYNIRFLVYFSLVKKQRERTWITLTHKEWQARFPWISEKTVFRILNKLEKLKLIISHKFYAKDGDHTKSYTLGFEEDK